MIEFELYIKKNKKDAIIRLLPVYDKEKLKKFGHNKPTIPATSTNALHMNEFIDSILSITYTYSCGKDIRYIDDLPDLQYNNNQTNELCNAMYIEVGDTNIINTPVYLDNKEMQEILSEDTYDTYLENYLIGKDFYNILKKMIEDKDDILKPYINVLLTDFLSLACSNDSTMYQIFTTTTSEYPIAYIKNTALEYLDIDIEDKYEEAKWVYPLLGYTNEIGEVSGKLKKAIRDSLGHISIERSLAIISELGDTEWYGSNLSYVLGHSKEKIINKNVKKLIKRVLDNKIKGDGDNR